MKFKLMNQAELRAIVEDSRDGLSDDAFADRYLLGLDKALATDKARYRVFGPYWPVVKSELVAMGLKAYGSEYDEDMAADFNYGNRALNVVAAYVYTTPRFESGELYNNTHILETIDGDVEAVVIEDQEMETLIHGSQMV